MVAFEPAPYGLRLTFTAGTAAQNVADCIAQGDAHFGRMPAGWRLLVDVRDAPIMRPPEFEQMSGYIAGFSNPPVRVAMLVASTVFAMQLQRLYRAVGASERVRVFDASVGETGPADAEAFLA